MNELLRDLKTIYQLIRPRRQGTHAEKIENFYKDQASDYDHFRSKLLPGRDDLFKMIEKWNPGPIWVDMGAGTGSNIEKINLDLFSDIYLVDLSPSLLEVAQKRKEKFSDKKIHIIRDDATRFALKEKVDLITFSYSLTMIPEWFSAIDHAIELLKPGGILAVVDFHIPTLEIEENSKIQKIFFNFFWPSWFSWDGVHLSRDHSNYLKNRLNVVYYEQDHHELPYIPYSQVPYYQLIGKKS